MEEEIEETPEVKWIDQEDFEDLAQCQEFEEFSELLFRWIEALEKEEEKWHRYLSKTLSAVSGRKGFCYRIVEKFARILRSQGAELVNSGVKGRRPIRSIAPRSGGETGNLPLVLKNFSVATKCVNLAHFIAKVLNHYGIARTELFTRTVTLERLNLLHLFHEFQNSNSQMELFLSNFRLLRDYQRTSRPKKSTKNSTNPEIFSTTRDYFGLLPQASLMALQAVLADWNSNFVLKMEKIVQIAHSNCVQMRAIRVKGDAIFVLNEALVALLALENSGNSKNPGLLQELSEFDEILTLKAKNLREKVKFDSWKLILKAQGSKNVNFAERLEEEAKLEHFGARCSVLVETACTVRAGGQEQHEKIVETISATISRHPALGPRMLKLAEKCKIGYERDNLLEQICESPSLHPSELVWLEFVEKQLARIGKLGSVKETLQKCLKVLFEYLDFDSNRFEEKAWILLKKTLEMSDPTFVAPEWRVRRQWWARFHNGGRKGVKMVKKAEKAKREVLEALEELVC